MTYVLNVLNVEDDDDDAMLIAFALEQVRDTSYRVRRVRSVEEVKPFTGTTGFDIVLLDLHLPDSQGTETVATVVDILPETPILVLTGVGGDQLGIGAIELGAQDFIPKTEMMTPLLPRSVEFAIRRKEMQREAEKDALTDSLTGLPNRAALERRLTEAVARTARHRVGFALAFLDLNGFKAVNDTHGHQAGDQVLAEIAKRMKSISRAEDFIGRLGGDEFVIVLDSTTDRDAATEVAKRYIESIGKPMQVSAGGQSHNVSVGASLGVAVCPQDGTTVEDLVRIADDSMYSDKRSSKGMFRIASRF